MLQTILSISGKPGLYKLVSSGKASLIVEAIDETHKPSRHCYVHRFRGCTLVASA